MFAAQKFITQKMRQFEEVGGWEVANEQAQHCTYQQYLEAGIEDCENTAKLVDSLGSALKAVKRELQARVERLEAREEQHRGILRIAESICQAAKETGSLRERCVKNTSKSDKPTLLSDEKQPHAMLPNTVLNQETPVTESQTSYASTSGSDGQKCQGTKKPAKRFVEKPCRPQTSLNGSFTIDQVDDNATFVEPVRRLSFDEPTTVFVDATAPVSYAPVDNGNSKKENAEPVHISKPPVLKSELAKKWIREVARKKF